MLVRVMSGSCGQRSLLYQAPMAHCGVPRVWELLGYLLWASFYANYCMSFWLRRSPPEYPVASDPFRRWPTRFVGLVLRKSSESAALA